MPIYVVSVLYISCIAYWMVGFNDSFFRFFLFVITLLFITYSIMSFALCFVFAFRSFVTGSVFESVFLGIFMVFSGAFINGKSVPKYWLWMPWVSVFSYAFKALIYIIFDGLNIECDLASGLCPTVIDSFGLGGYSLTGAVFLGLGYMSGWILVFMLLSYLFLRYRRFQ